MKYYQQLENTFKKINDLDHLSAITSWDEAVMMPAGGGDARAQALATLSEMRHELLASSEVADLIAKAKQENIADPWGQENLFWIEREHVNASCLSSDLVKATTQASMKCEQAWRTMRAENNWRDFMPLLKITFELVQESANIRSEIFKISPYDVLIDDYSPGLTQDIINPIFDKLKQALPPIIEQTLAKQVKEQIIEPQGPFEIAKQRELGLELMQKIGFDFEHGRLDVSHHPFCGGVAEDVRITTRYDENDFVAAAMGICHETGHARYEQNLPKQWVSQPVGEALGMSMHESQSLIVEMQACRTYEFMQVMAPLLEKYFGVQYAFSVENLHRIYTRVKPGLIRVDADELTYPLHVILRYEIERDLMNGQLAINDLPDAWDAKMQAYLNLSTKGNDKDGVMQDVHWPSGGFGYFPAYTFGSLIAAQLFDAAKSANPTLLDGIKHGDFSILGNWLKQNIHQRASSVDMQQLLQDATGEVLNPDYFIEHAKARYLN